MLAKVFVERYIMMAHFIIHLAVPGVGKKLKWALVGQREGDVCFTWCTHLRWSSTNNMLHFAAARLSGNKAHFSFAGGTISVGAYPSSGLLRDNRYVSGCRTETVVWMAVHLVVL